MSSGSEPNLQAPPLESRLVTALSHLYAFTRRGMTIASLIVGIYVIVGSCMFGEWWYGFFWDRGFERTAFLADGVDYLLAQRIVLSIGIVVAVFIAIVGVTLLKRKVLPFIDRFAWLVFLSVFAAVVIDAFVIRNTEAEGYAVIVSWQQAADDADAVFSKIPEIGTPPKIEPPIYFYYLDETRIAGLYNQIEPELEEKQREVMGSTSLKGKADVGTGGIGVGIEAGSESQRKTTLTPPESSSDRKCIAVMKYVRNTWPENYYTSEGDFYFRQLSEEQDQQRKLLIDKPVTKAQLESLRALSLGGVKARAQKLRAQLRRELLISRGLIFVDGEFTRSENAGKLAIVRKLSTNPPCTFRISLPKHASGSLPATKPLRLRVFGDVVRPLEKDGYIEVAGIAIF